MDRRTFVTHSLLGNAPVGLGPHTGVGSALSALQATGESELSDESRFHELSSRLDYGAMQRGWAQTVDPDYQHAPPQSIEAFKDLHGHTG